MFERARGRARERESVGMSGGLLASFSRHLRAGVPVIVLRDSERERGCVCERARECVEV